MKLTRDFAYWLVVAASVLWLALVFLAPYARAESWPSAPHLYAFFHPVCHQLPERSFHCFGQPLAVCHRCLGLYAGFLVGLLTLPYLDWLRERLLETPRAILLFFVPMLLDVLIVKNTYLTRLFTGLVAAFPIGLLVWAAAEQILHPRPGPGTKTHQGEIHEPSRAQ
ncbi:MAG: DUF2085 domain-containing protein [bacterium]|nr:DUF2085 domain-containing protein [bacterium]